jgi:hypothetical protein
MFSRYEVSRQVHLMFTLNVVATVLDGYYKRNEGATRHLDAQADKFPEKQNVVNTIEEAALHFNRLRFRVDSFWYAKSNAFSLLITLCEYSGRFDGVDQGALKEALISFGNNPPDEYALAAREGVNNKKERGVRARYLRQIMERVLPA